MNKSIFFVLTCLTASVNGATWTTQSTMLPRFEWVVLDHADGNSMGYGATIAQDHIFISGSMKEVARVENPQTGVAVESTDLGTDGDIFLAKVSTDGRPKEIWTYSGSQNEFPSHLATSTDDMYISMTGYFAGDITFGDFTFTNTKDASLEVHGRDNDDGFVVKVSAEDGSVVWAKQFIATSGTTCRGTSFDKDGNIAVVGRRCQLNSDETEKICNGFFALLAAADGSVIFDVDYDSSFSLSDIMVDPDEETFYLVGSLQGSVVIDTDNTLSSESEDYSDAVLLALDAEQMLKWAVIVSGDDDSSSSLVEVLGNNIYMSCGGGCKTVTSTSSETELMLEGLYGGGVIKIANTGLPLWAADVPSALGMAVTEDAVYTNTQSWSTMQFGDLTFMPWGSLDQYIFKLDTEGGKGEWVLQTGGEGLEYIRRMTADSNGDVYTIGLTESNPSHFTPIVLESHDATNGYDVFIAKLQASQESLPPCKSDANTVMDGYCFVNNLCYADGEHAREASVSMCHMCSAGQSQTSMTMIDGYELGEDGSCSNIWIAHYDPSTDVSTHSMIDLDAKEIEEYSDSAEWDMALFVYENGGGGLCTEEDIATTDDSHPCYGMTTADPRGNSVKGSGDIRTIAGFATSGRAKMSEWPLWNLYRDYWGDDNYADTFIKNALSPSGAWSSRSDALRAELSAKGAKYQAVWMYVIHEMEDAVADCRSGNIFDNDASNSAGDSPHAWDEAWAFYSGSLEGVDGSGKGYLLYDLAEKRCPQFGTCTSSGAAVANSRALSIANEGLERILDSDCDAVAAELDNFVIQMVIPVMQGLVRYLYLADPTINQGSCNGNVCTYDKEWAEGWAFAAALLPLIDQCDSTVADLLVANLDVDGPSKPMADGYEYVKAQLETTYACLGLTCGDIGAYQNSEGIIYPGMDACTGTQTVTVTKTETDTKKKTNKALVIGLAAALGVVALIALLLGVMLCRAKRAPMNDSYRSDKFKNVLIEENKDVETASDIELRMT